MPNFEDVLKAEQEAIADLRTQREARPSDPEVGLAFSGGGIRSATFCLGFLQGLAKANMLGQIDYLSTVSGGGYIGAWLISWIKRAGSVASVDKTLGGFVPHQETGVLIAEPKPVNFLRDYSNYLTPRKGIFGADTWAAIASYLKNVFLNQLVLILLLGPVICLPWLMGRLVEFGSGLPLAWLGGVTGVILIFTVWESSGRAEATSLIGVRQKQAAKQKYVLLLAAVPLFLSSILLTLAFWKAPRRFDWMEWAAIGALIYGVAQAVGILARQRVQRNTIRPENLCTEQPVEPTSTEKEMGPVGLSVWRKILIPALGVVAGAVGGLLFCLVGHVFYYWQHCITSESGAWHAVSWGPPIFVTAMLLAGTLHIGLLKFLIPSQEHEWWARAGGLLLLIALGWAGLFALSVFVPFAAFIYGGWVKTKLALLAGWILSTGAGVFLGKSKNTSGRPEDNTKWDTVAVVTPYIFVVGLLALLSMGVHNFVLHLPGAQESPSLNQAVTKLETATVSELSVKLQSMDGSKPLGEGNVKLNIAGTITAAPKKDLAAEYWLQTKNVALCQLGMWTALLSLICILLSWRVDINNFSMNPFYRNRLVRCYLGASHKNRECSANPFTGFDPADDTFLADFVNEKGYRGPYPLVCAALNVTHGERLAWQERKAESFVFAPKLCGFEYPDMHPKEEGQEASAPIASRKKEGFQPTNEYGYPVTQLDASHETMGGVRLGTAISISGAAASPNMGFHTSPPLAFLMTIFDVRLGWWLPNPRYASKEFTIPPHGGPKLSLLYLLCELFATTTDRSKFVYLSDGGHFENLAIYELVRRRCPYIIACDADADKNMTFGDLGNAIRKCRSDFGVEISIDPTPVKLPPGSSTFAQVHGVIGQIHYPRLSEEKPEFTGRMLYVKPTITKDVPRDVLAYRDKCPGFPNQATANQWFDESQFESYRRLGLFSFQKLTGTTDPATNQWSITIPDFFELVKEQLAK